MRVARGGANQLNFSDAAAGRCLDRLNQSTNSIFNIRLRVDRAKRNYTRPLQLGRQRG